MFFLFSVFPRVLAIYPLSKKTNGRDITYPTNPSGVPRGVRPAPGPDGLPDGSMYFYGRRGSYIEFPNHGRLDATYSVTIIAWIYPQGSGPIFHYSPRGVRFWVIGRDRLQVTFVGRNGRSTTPLIARALIPNRWNYVAVSYDNRYGWL